MRADRSMRPRYNDRDEPGRTQGARARVGALLRPHRQRHAHRGDRHQRPRDRRSADRRRPRRRRPHDREGRCRSWCASTSSGSSPIPTCRRSSRPAAPASPRATAPTKRSPALLQKRLDGFGELFRMLSYEQIGAAAMMSRACAGLVAGRIVVVAAGIGSGGAAGDGAAADSRARTPRAAGDATVTARGEVVGDPRR